MEAILRRADASLEKWFRGAKQRGAGILRHRVADLQAGLNKLSAGIEQLERERALTPPSEPAEPNQKATPRKRRPRPATARKPSAPRKHKKAA